MKIIIKKKNNERKESFLAVVAKAAQPAGSSCVTCSVPLQLVCGTSKPSGGAWFSWGGSRWEDRRVQGESQQWITPKATPRGFWPLWAQLSLGTQLSRGAESSGEAGSSGALQEAEKPKPFAYPSCLDLSTFFFFFVNEYVACLFNCFSSFHEIVPGRSA